MRVFDSKDVVDFISHAMDSDRFGRGARAELAGFLGVKPSFVSLALTRKLEFNLEHVYKVAEFLGLKEDERSFLILLSQRDRAGTTELKKHFQVLLDKELKKRSKIKNRTERESQILGEFTEQELNEFFASYLNISIHMLLRNEKVTDTNEIISKLREDPRAVRKSLEVLERLGMIKRSEKGWKSLERGYHLSKKSFALKMHHHNWRIEAMNSLKREDLEHTLHYSAVMSIDSAAAAKIQEILLDTIANSDPAIQQAKDEEVHALTIDFFKIA